MVENPNASEKHIEEVQDLLAQVFQIDLCLPKVKARSLAAQFTSIGEFLGAKPEDFGKFKSVRGERSLILNEAQLQNLFELQKSGFLNPKATVSENHIASISRAFIRRQVTMLEKLTLERMNPNPFLIQSLNLSTASDVVSLNVYMAATRSIVTSMGYFIEQLLLTTSSDVKKLREGWDLLKEDEDGTKNWIQVKSGPNDMDLDQIRYWAVKIEETVNNGGNAFLGTTYGKKGSNTVSLQLIQRSIPNWEKHTLIGRELWDFLSDDPSYHQTLFRALKEAAIQIIGGKSILPYIEKAIAKVLREFIDKYGDGEDGVNNYLADIF